MFEPRGSDGHAACTSPPRVDRGASRRTAGNRNRFAVCTATTLLLACSNSVKVTASDVGAASVKLSAAGLPLSTGGFNGLDDSVFFGMSWVPELPADLSKYIVSVAILIIYLCMYTFLFFSFLFPFFFSFSRPPSLSLFNKRYFFVLCQSISRSLA